jgi:hypothetical protein
VEPSLYGVLWVSNTAPADAIKKAYRELARAHHPHVSPGDAGAESRFRRLSAAWDVLGEPAKRKLEPEGEVEHYRARGGPKRGVAGLPCPRGHHHCLAPTDSATRREQGRGAGRPTHGRWGGAPPALKLLWISDLHLPWADLETTFGGKGRHPADSWRWLVTPTLHRPQTLALSLIALVVALGCREDDSDDGDAGDADYGPLLVLDEALVTDRMARLVAVAPTCSLTSAEAGGDRSDATRDGSSASPPPAGVGAVGSCGGTLEVMSDHNNGVTVYELDFSDFCMAGDVTDVVMNGLVIGTEFGTPSDSGPVIEALEMETNGPLEVVHDGARMEFTLAGARVDYGVPATWGPGVPTAEAPDVTVVESLTVHFPDGEEADVTLADVRAERVGASPSYTIDGGVLAFAGVGHVALSTAPGQPVVLDPFQPESGAILLDGADDTQIAVTMGTDPLLRFTYALDGDAMDAGLDCSATTPLLLEAVGALFQALPFY